MNEPRWSMTRAFAGEAAHIPAETSHRLLCLNIYKMRFPMPSDVVDVHVSREVRA